MNKSPEDFIFEWNVKAQRALFTDLKVRLKKQKLLAPPL